VNPVPYPLLLKKSGSALNRTLTTGSVGRDSDHYTTEGIRKNETEYKLRVMRDALSCKGTGTEASIIYVQEEEKRYSNPAANLISSVLYLVS
jgi:hypothetical protein